ncbi:hypothetical protein K456DRAFT_1851992, partial [Colletotrichum gloeosporioides 23]
EAAGIVALTPTQRVVMTLLSLRKAARYHVHLDNLFASVRLFQALRKVSIGATSTCRKDRGIDEIVVADRPTKARVSRGVQSILSQRQRVNQFTWKDNALALFLTTVFQSSSEVVRYRRGRLGGSRDTLSDRRI